MRAPAVAIQPDAGRGVTPMPPREARAYRRTMTTIAPSALEQAEAAFRRGDFAAARDLLAGATGARALTVLGAAEHALHDDVAAEAHSRAALEAWGRDAGGEPPAALHNNLGLAIAGQGRIAEAIPSLLAAVNAEPNSRDFRANLALHLLALGSQAHHDAVRVALGAPGAPEGVIAAIVAYERGDLAACRRVLDLVRPGFEARAAGGMDARQWHNLDVYRRYLGALLRERERNPSRYAEPGVLPALTFVGDSHSLIPAGLRVRFLGQEWRGVPHLVMGAKAWHVSRGVDNRYGAAFRIALGRLSEGATAVAMFGEIDCRADEGILPRALAHPEEPLDASVEALVRGYVA
jgi:tetratricopeptide (TPR) repeat protein